MSNQHLDNLEVLDDYEEIFHFLENIIKDSFEFDGFTIVVSQKNENKFTIFTQDIQYRDIEILPQSMIKEMFYSNKAQIISQPDSYDKFNRTLDCFDAENISSLLLYPIIREDNDIDIVLSFWKKFEKEKEQVIEPLIVGSQRMGVTTRVKSTIIHKNFEDKDLQAIEDIKDVLIVAIKKLILQIELQKQSMLEQISSNEEVFKTPQEIIATLINIIIGTNSSIHNLKDILLHIKKTIHHNDKIAPYIDTMQEILDKLDQNMINTFNFSANNDIIKGLFKAKESIDTRDFFEHFATFTHDIVCQKGISLNFFLDPKMPKNIDIEKQNSYIFLINLLEFTFDDATQNRYFNISITKDKNKQACIFRVSYNKENQNIQYYRNIFLNKKDIFDNSLYLSYKKFVQTGGKVSIGVDDKQQKVSFSVTIPYENSSDKMLVDIVDTEDIKIGILLDKKDDLQSANTIARYLLSLGVSKGQIKASEKFNLFDEKLTHIVIFQSKFSEELFEKLKSISDIHTMTVSNGCLQENDINFYDYSQIDMEIDKNRFYLYEIKEFIQFKLR